MTPTLSPPVAPGVCRCGCGMTTRIAPVDHEERGWTKGEPMPYVARHVSLPNVDYVEHDRGHDTPCWIWQRAMDFKDGYGRTFVDGRNTAAHRAYFEMFVGAIPEGLEVDHLCHVRPCVNPDHLRAVTTQTNLRARTHVKLTDADVSRIRSIKGRTQQSIADEYGVTQGHISEILSEERWAA